MNDNSTNPLHGKKLEQILNELVDFYGWEELGEHVNVRCFNFEPSIKSSLRFLRKVEHRWARDKVEKLYVKMIEKI